MTSPADSVKGLRGWIGAHDRREAELACGAIPPALHISQRLMDEVRIAADLIERQAAEIEELKAKWAAKFCERCNQLACNAVVQTCSEEPCPLRHHLTAEQQLARTNPRFALAPRRLPLRQERGSK